MAKVVIVGAGVMGSAFSFPLADAGQQIHLVGTHLDRDWIEGIRSTGVHPKLQMTLPDRVIPFTHDQLQEALDDGPDLIVLGVSSAGVQWAIQQLGPLLTSPVPIVMLTKGLAVRDNRLHVLPDIVREGLAGYGIEQIPVGAVGGPCIAGELAAKRDSSVVIGLPDPTLLQKILTLMAAPYYHARPSTDLIGVEVCAALKNFYALAVGYANGRLAQEGKSSNGAFMHNLAAGLFTQALAEIGYFVEQMGGTQTNVRGLAGTGDFYVTCLAGRNSRMGNYLGKGYRYSEAKTTYMAEDTVEGAELALTIGPTVEALAQQGRFDRSALPLAFSIIKAICHDEPMHIPWEHFYRDR